MPEYMLCRICLTEDTDTNLNMTPLFDEHNMQGKELVRKIEEIGSIKLLPLVDIPSMLCSNCLQTLSSAYKFRETIQASERTFSANVIKDENDMKLEPTDDQTHIQIESHDVEYIYEGENEFIDADEEVELSGMLEERLEDDGDEDQMEYTVVASDDADEKDIFLTYSSDSDYQPSERVRKPKNRKGRPNKRGRPRNTTSKRDHDITSPNATKSPGKLDDGSSVNIMCEVCGNIYSKRGALNVHMRRHMAEKPFECEICGKTFAGPSELNRHIRVHTGEKPFTCKYCSRSFADRSSNIRHERTHTNERPFTCSTCGKAFSYSNVLKNHMLTHTGEKPFVCLPCNKTFSRKHQLEQHLGTLTHKQTANSRQAAVDIKYQPQTQMY
ncbi:transcription factor Ouib [Scaptodrosophila lebanonensis]|uniref:Transcription factor Ouib n=1 Tax=Drosophila lebanonensis TaxID=7225 RepID=A0A6J2TFH3_DROLE|nr:transcription factor Ouib [Scaptodrosophila lebanonensis]